MVTMGELSQRALGLDCAGIVSRIERRAWIYSEIKAEVSVFELLTNTPITGLARDIVEKSKAVPQGILDAN